MSNKEKYDLIMSIISPMIPKEITGTKRRNARSNIKLYVKRGLDMSEVSLKRKAIVHLSIREKVEELLERMK